MGRRVHLLRFCKILESIIVDEELLYIQLLNIFETDLVLDVIRVLCKLWF